MRLQVPKQPSPNLTIDVSAGENVVRESSERKGFERTASVTPTHANKKPVSLNDEERQDVSIGNETEQQKSKDELEYEILCKEIDRIDQNFQSGATESEQQISLTSTFSKDAEISQTMHEKLMRLIKAMIPNSTTEQKNSFIRDLFEMGLRVSENSATRLQIEQINNVERQTQPSVDEMTIGDSNSIVDNGNEDSVQQNPHGTISTSNPHMDDGLKMTPSLDDYIDGANSILASKDEGDMGELELANSVHASVSSRRYIEFQATNSSDAVDARWEQLRDKMLNDSASGRTKNSMSSEMETHLIQECVETGLAPSQKPDTIKVNRQQGQIYEKPEGTVTSGQNNPQKSISKESFSPNFVKNRIHHENSVQYARRRPGQADDSSTGQPVQQRNNTASDSFSVDAMPLSTSYNSDLKKTSDPSFDEDLIQENDMNLLEDANIINSEHISGIMGETTNRMQKSTLHQLSEDEIMINRSQPGCNDLQNSAHEDISEANTRVVQNQSMISRGESVNGKNTVMANESLDFESGHSFENLIYVQSSLTCITDAASPAKEPFHSFYKSVNLSLAETFERIDENTESPDSTTSVQPSWRLSPEKSLSDFTLTVLSSETGTATNYHVHRHMMAVGPRSSQYMNEVFASENASHFEVTLDEKTSVIIPEILDFIYCDGHDVSMNTDNVVAFRQLAKMLKIWPLEVKAANFILEDMRVDNLVTYVSDCSHFNDNEVMKAVVEKCTENLESIPVDDRLWIVMEPELFHEIISSPHIDRGSLSKHLSILLKEYLDLHQYEIAVDLFVALTSDNIIPIVDRSAALPLIELSDNYSSTECEDLQKRCAFTIACYWQTTPQAERHRLFALMRHLSSSITVDFLEIVESGHSTLEMLRSEMEQQTIGGNQKEGKKQEPVTVEDLCGDLVDEKRSKEKLCWRMDREKSYSDMSIRVEYLNHEGFQMYHVHKQIVAVGPHRSKFLAKHLNPGGTASKEKICIVIKLDYEGSSVVPQLLDFLYSQDTELEISHENAVALHYVTRAFEIVSLSREIMKFIDHNLTFANITDYIIDGGYYRDHMTIATAGRLCAREITSIDTDSKILKELEPDFFEKVVSCNIIEECARSHVNILIMKYLSIRNLEHEMIEKLLQSIHIDKINKDSALNVLKTVIRLKEYEGVAMFERMKTKSVDVITEDWTDLTSDDECRREIFSLLPFFPSSLVVSIFEAVDSKTREERGKSASRQAMVEKSSQERVSEANRLRQEEVSRLKREIEMQTATMHALQKELDGRLFPVDRTPPGRPTASNGAVIPKPPPPKAPSPKKSMKEIVYEADGDWYYEEGGNVMYGEMNEMDEGMEVVGEIVIGGTPPVSEHVPEVVERNDNSNHSHSIDEIIEVPQSMSSDERSVSTAHVQKKKGRKFCC